MRVPGVVAKLCDSCRAHVHAGRFTAVLAAVDALANGAGLTVTSIGRGLAGKIADKHQIKRIDRLVGNHRLHGERELFFGALAQRLVQGVKRPVVAIDWTHLRDDTWAIVATIVFQGRGLPIYASVHSKDRVASVAAHKVFLSGLRRVLPAPMRPVLVADAGFKSPFFQQCDALGFDFVIRLRGNGYIQRWHRGRRTSFRELWQEATHQSRCLGKGIVYSKTWRRVVIGPKPAARAAKPATDSYEQRRALEPWLLATSLNHLEPEKVVAIYETRMQIEETFRDTKNPRLGWALDHSQTKSHMRIANLIMLASIAMVALALIGLVAEQSELHRRFQANTIRNRRVISLVRLGALVVQKLPNYIRWSKIKIAIANAAKALANYCRVFKPSPPTFAKEMPDCPLCEGCAQLCFDFYWVY